MKTNMTMRRICGATLSVTTVLALTAGTAFGAEPEGVEATIGQAVQPVSGQHMNVPAPEGPGDEEIAPPAHPPIDQVPPAPMHYPNVIEAGFKVESDNTLLIHNAETGETIEIPAAFPTEGFGGQGGDTFQGVAGDSMDDIFQTEGFGSMSIISDASRASFPWSANVKLLMQFTRTNGTQAFFVCSGSMNDPGVVLTAAHCIFNRDSDINDFADQVWIYPGWDGDGNLGNSFQTYDQWGYAVSTSYIAGSGYVNSGDWDRDAAALRINRFRTDDGGRNIGALTGYFSWAWGFGCSTIQGRTYNNASYPSEGCGTSGLHNGRDMTYWFGTIDSCPGNQMELSTSPGCYTAVWGGMSGSAMYYIEGDNRFAHAVCSTSNRSTIGRYAKLWEQFTTDMVNFESDTRGASFDLEPLQVRSNGDTVARAGEAFTDGFTVQMVNATNNNPGSNTYQIEVYLSTNNNISTADRLLATWNYTLDFAANQVRQFNIPAPFIPLDVAPGDYWIGVQISSAPGDGNSANNDSDTWDAQPVVVQQALPPQAPTLTFPSNFATGVDITANLDWLSATNATSYDVYFGTDSTPDAGEFVGNTTSTAWNLPLLSYSTTYYWQIVAKGPGGNASSSVFRFTTDPQPAPDMLAAALREVGDNTYYQGERIDISHGVQNIGNATAPGVQLDMRLSTNTIISTADWALGTRSIGNILAGSSNSGVNAYQVPLNTTPGLYYVGMIVSTTGDSDNGNNTAFDSVQVSVSECPGDLAAPYGQLTFADISAFLAAFNGQQPPADFALPFGSFTFADISAFLQAFSSGCP